MSLLLQLDKTFPIVMQCVGTFCPEISDDDHVILLAEEFLDQLKLRAMEERIRMIYWVRISESTRSSRYFRLLPKAGKRACKLHISWWGPPSH